MKFNNILFLFVMLLFPNFCFSQNNNGKARVQGEQSYKKKIIKKEYKANWKTSNYAKADEILRNAFNKYNEAKGDPELLCLASNVKYQLYLEENRKIYLNNKGDTVNFFNYLYDTHIYGLKCDSICNISQIKYGEKKRYRSDINEHLSSMRNNLLSGGKFFLKKNKYEDALKYFNLYLSTNHNPLVYKAKNSVVFADSDSVEVTKLAVHAAYGCGRYEKVMNYYFLAVSDTVRRELLMEMGAKSALQIEDTITYYDILRSGFEGYPQNDYFKANLIQYYHNKNDVANTLKIIDRCIEIDSLNVKYWKLKGNELMSIDSLDMAKDAYIKVMDIDSTDFETSAVLGNIFLEKARRFYNQTNLRIGSPNYKENRNILNDLYKNAQVYFENVKNNCPTQPDLWKEGLREVYYRLNNGKELKKLEAM